ncbi:hypothetical protein [uncultured Sphingomonas sp.]|uniref:hypothetical protein n=1 Tax=uncultured Sphingomonas sp. TaxID=158754 RepID=UPI0025DF8DD9|nr:hypothetical protein [uncultured Sphingomonas sp.]
MTDHLADLQVRMNATASPLERFPTALSLVPHRCDRIAAAGRDYDRRPDCRTIRQDESHRRAIRVADRRLSVHAKPAFGRHIVPIRLPATVTKFLSLGGAMAATTCAASSSRDFCIRILLHENPEPRSS